MKHFLATHTCMSEESRRGFIEHSKVLTDRQMFEGIKTDKAEMIAHWMGREEFFFCHWYAESEEAIHDALANLGLDKIVVTMANEMTRYISKESIEDELVGDPDA